MEFFWRYISLAFTQQLQDLLAFIIPANKAISDKTAINRLSVLVEILPNEDKEETEWSSREQLKIIEGIKEIANQAGTPLQFFENPFHHFAYFVVVSIFAFANAGIIVDSAALAIWFHQFLLR